MTDTRAGRGPLVEYRRVHVAFDLPVLSGVTLAVRRGEMLGVVGPSGAGKSVLLKTTIGLLVPDRGDVLVEGESIFSSPGTLERVRRQTGYVFQNAALFDSLIVQENVAMGIPPDFIRRLAPQERQRRIEGALEDVNLEPEAILDKLPAELSGGMRKRVGLARALVGRPEILLYDEPVTGLDPVNAASVSRLIVEIARRSGSTSLLVTHDVEGALAICDRIALLAGGRIRFVGAPREFRESSDPLVRAFADRRAAEAIAEAGLERNGDRGGVMAR